MELWKQLEILRKTKRNWLFEKTYKEERIEALNNILALGLPSAISYLIPFLKDKNPEIRNLTCKVVVELFKKISTKRGFYEAVKYSDISKSDIDFYKDSFPENAYVVLIAISSLNSNGYIREKAVEKLAETQNQFAIQFIIYRLADWVKNVRDVAIKELENFKKTEFLNGLIGSLETFEWLQSVERTDLSSDYADIVNFIIIQNKNYVLENFKTFSDKTRIIIAKQLTKSQGIEQEDLQLLLSDKHFIIRNLVLTNFDKLSESQINQLLKDKFARVRYETLYKLKDRPDFKKLAFDFIADDSEIIRNYVRYTLKEDIKNFASVYNDNLESGHDVIGSIGGIAETNGKAFIPTIERHLKHKSIRVRKYSFLALKKLDENLAYNFALANLDTEFVGLRKMIIDFLEVKPTNEVLETARGIYQNGNYDLKKSMLILFSKIGKWTAIADLMIGTLDETENLRNLSIQFVEQWKTKANSYFTLPKPDELERTNQIFRYAYELHEQRKYYKINPLKEIDFYLK